MYTVHIDFEDILSVQGQCEGDGLPPPPGRALLTFCLLPPPLGNDMVGGSLRRLTAPPEVKCRPRSCKPVCLG